MNCGPYGTSNTPKQCLRIPSAMPKWRILTRIFKNIFGRISTTIAWTGNDICLPWVSPTIRPTIPQLVLHNFSCSTVIRPACLAAKIKHCNRLVHLKRMLAEFSVWSRLVLTPKCTERIRNYNKNMRLTSMPECMIFNSINKCTQEDWSPGARTDSTAARVSPGEDIRE